MESKNKQFSAYQRCQIRNFLRSWMVNEGIGVGSLEDDLNKRFELADSSVLNPFGKRGVQFHDKTLKRFIRNAPHHLPDQLLEKLVVYLEESIGCSLYLPDSEVETRATFDELKTYFKFKQANNTKPLVVEDGDNGIKSIAGIKFPCQFSRYRTSNYKMKIWADCKRDPQTIFVFGNLRKYVGYGLIEKERISFEGTLCSKNGIHYLLCRDHLYFEPCIMIIKNKDELVFKNNWLGKEIDQEEAEEVYVYRRSRNLKWNFKP